MKRTALTISTLAMLLMSLGAVTSAYAALAAFSPNPATLNGVVTGGMPAWYQDQNGVAVQPCFDIASCGLIGLGDPNFNEAQPLAFPPPGSLPGTGNFPIEAFYFNATTGDIPMGTGSAFVVMALEYTFVDPITGIITSPKVNPNVKAAPFQRLRLVETIIGGAGVLPAGAVGNFVITTPWGVSTFPVSAAKCVNSGGNTKCTITRDLPLPAAAPNFAGALGVGIPAPDSAISTFLKAPAPPPGFLGNAVAVLSFTGGVLGNTVTVTDPIGNTGTTGALKILTGKLFGMDVAPLAGNFPDTAITTPTPTSSAAQTFTVTNINTVSTMTINGTPGPTSGITLTGPNAADFVVAADTCSGVALPTATGACTFTVAFAPKPLTPAAEVALRTATVNIAATFGVPAGAPVGTPAPPPPPNGLIQLSGTGTYTMSASADPNGTITPASAAIIVKAGATQSFTIQPNKKFQVKDILVNGALAHFAAPADPLAAVTFTAPAATSNGTIVNATFMPSGNLTGSGKLGVDDALKALKILVGVQVPVGDDLVAMKVAPLDATGRPSGTGAPDLNDVVLILKRVLGIITW